MLQILLSKSARSFFYTAAHSVLDVHISRLQGIQVITGPRHPVYAPLPKLCFHASDILAVLLLRLVSPHVISNGLTELGNSLPLLGKIEMGGPQMETALSALIALGRCLHRIISHVADRSTTDMSDYPLTRHILDSYSCRGGV